MEYTVSEVAKIRGVSERAVYKQLKTHAAKLEGHIIVRQGKKWLDERAVEILNSASQNSPSYVVEDSYKDKYDELKLMYDEMQARMQQREDLIAKMSEKMLEMRSEASEDRQSRELLLEEKGALKHELEAEKGKVEELEQELGRYEKTIFGLYRKK